MFWSKEVAPKNIERIVVTDAVFHPLMSWLKTGVAPSILNISLISVTASTFPPAYVPDQRTRLEGTYHSYLSQLPHSTRLWHQ